MNANRFTVLARATPDDPWTEWTTWVDRVTAYAELDHARRDGYRARVVDAEGWDRRKSGVL